MEDENVILTYKILDYIRMENELIDSEYVYYNYSLYYGDYLIIKMKADNSIKFNKMVNFLYTVSRTILNKQKLNYPTGYTTFDSNIEYFNDENEQLIYRMVLRKVHLNDIDQNIKIRSIEDVIDDLDKFCPGILFGG